MVSTPARMASLIASVPWAWAATFIPRAWASVTMAVISSRLICWAPTESPLDSTPPEAQILIRSAPNLRTCRTLARNSQGPSATLSTLW